MHPQGADSCQADAIGDMQRYFTIDQANRALVLVKRVIADVMTGYRKLVDLQEVFDASDGDPRRRAEDELTRIATQMKNCAEELEDIGVYLQDFSKGIVDFPCLLGGREICLCWKYGEKRIEHWHDLGRGFSERRPLAELYAEQELVAT